MSVDQEKYKDTRNCPNCGSHAPAHGSTDLNPDGENIYRLRRCSDCGCEWEECFTLDCITVHKAGAEKLEWTEFINMLDNQVNEKLLLTLAGSIFGGTFAYDKRSGTVNWNKGE